MKVKKNKTTEVMKTFPSHSQGKFWPALNVLLFLSSHKMRMEAGKVSLEFKTWEQSGQEQLMTSRGYSTEIPYNF